MEREYQNSTSSVDFVSVNWRDQSLHIMNQLRKLIGPEGMFKPDVNIRCDGGVVYCHKVLLCACSRYFAEAFKDVNVYCDSLIWLPSVSATTFRSIYEYMLNGKVMLPIDQASLFFKAGNDLEVEGLIGQTIATGSEQDIGAVCTKTRGISIGVVSTPMDVPSLDNLPGKDIGIDFEAVSFPSTSFAVGQARPTQLAECKLRIESPVSSIADDNASKEDSGSNDAVVVSNVDQPSNDNGFRDLQNDQERCVTVKPIGISVDNANLDSNKHGVAVQDSSNECSGNTGNKLRKLVTVNNKKKKTSTSIPASNKCAEESSDENEMSDDSDFKGSCDMTEKLSPSQKTSSRLSAISNRLKIRSLSQLKKGKKTNAKNDFSQPSSEKRIIRRKRRGNILHEGNYYTRQQAKKIYTNCPRCNKKLKLSTIKWHVLNTCKGKKPAKNTGKQECDFEDCQFSSSDPDEVRVHVESHKEKFYCNVCQQMFTTKEKRNLHKLKCSASCSGNVEVDHVEQVDTEDMPTSQDE